MKIISGLISVLILTLLALPSHATETRMAVVSKDILSGVKNLDTLDTIIDTSRNTITYYFKTVNKNDDGNLRLDNDQGLIISGTPGTMVGDLEGYKGRYIQNSSLQMTWNVAAYGCYKSRFGKATTYILVVGHNAGWNTAWCTGTWTLLIPDTSGVKVSNLSMRVENIRRN